MIDFRIEDQIPFIHCRDLEITSDFYESIMGFELVLDQGDCRIVRTTQRRGGYLGYCVRESRGHIKDGLILTLVTDGVDEWYSHLVDKGVQILEKPRLNPDYGIYHFFFRDPDGYQIEIQSFQDRSWSGGA